MGYIGKRQPQNGQDGQVARMASGLGAASVYPDNPPPSNTAKSLDLDNYDSFVSEDPELSHSAPTDHKPYPPTPLSAPAFASIPLVRPSNYVAITQKDRITGIWAINTETGTNPTVSPSRMRNPSANLSLHSSSGIKADIQVVANDGAQRPPAVIDCVTTSKKAIVRIVSPRVISPQRPSNDLGLTPLQVSRDYQRIKLTVTSSKSDVYLALPDDFRGYLSYTMMGARKPKDTFSCAIMDKWSTLESGPLSHGPVRGSIGDMAGDEEVDDVEIKADNGKLYLSYYSQDFGTNPFTWGYSQGKEQASRND